MLCPSCGTANADGSKFCRECGARLSVACAQCGTALAAGSKFCAECGAPQAAMGDGATALAPAPPGAERRLVSVLFADLVGFTALSESRDAEQVRELLSSYFAGARKTVERYGGTVEKFIGDAVMAAWGTPTAHEDDAERAVRAALDIVDAVRVMGEEAGIGELAARAGVLTGEAAVTLGATGEGMLAGDLVNTAARLQSVAEAGTVLVGDATRRATQGSIAYEPAGEHELKGKSAPVPAFRAREVIAKRRGEGRSELIEPPFVGRGSELRLLKDLFHATGDESRPRLVSVLGQAGIGKSRLAWELLKYVDGVTEVAYWHHGRSPAYGDGVAFWALGEMVRSRAGMVEGEGEETARPKLAAMLETFIPDPGDRAWIGPQLEDLLGLRTAAEDAAPGRERVFAAWRTLFERISTQGTVVMVFEDLHWADTGLLDFIEHLLDWSRTQPIYIVALARPELLERRSDWGISRRNAVALQLDPLSDAAMRQLLDGVVSGLPEAGRSAILERAEGIPLYAVETIRMLAQDGRLVRDGDRYRPAGDLGDLAVPETLHALIAARLDTLGTAERTLLQAASTLGKTFSADALAAVVGQEVEALEPRLRNLLHRELLVIDADPRSPERGQYSFVQALMREVAYSTLSRRDRRRLHLTAAQHFERLGDDELSGILATHYVAAYEAQPEGPEGEAVAAQARVALRAAAERTGRLGSWDRAHGYLTQALLVTRDPSDRAELLQAAGNAARLSARHDAAVAALEEVVQIRQALGDRRALLGAAAQLGRALVSRGGMEAAHSYLKRAAEEFGDLSGSAEYVDLAAELTRVLMRVGHDEEGVALADRILPTAERAGTLASLLELLVNRGTSLTNMMRLAEGAATLVGAMELARLNDMPVAEIRAIVNLSFAAELDEPRLDQSPRGLELIRRYGMRFFLPFMLNNFIEARLARGAWDEALRVATEHAESAITENERERLASMPVDLLVLRGELDGAGALASFGLWAEIRDDPQVQAFQHVTTARIALAEGRLDETVDENLASVAAFQAVGVTPLGDAALAAIRLKDPGRAAAVRSLLADRPGRTTGNHLRILDAGIAALDGRLAEAGEGYREGLRIWREFGYEYWLAMTVLTMVSVLPITPELREWTAEARQRFEAMGARPLMAQLDEALAVRGAEAARHPGSRETVEAEARG